jgi:anthranilate phosphoribosyltransferase
MIAAAIRDVVEGRNLSRDTTFEVFSALMDGQLSDIQKAAFLTAMRMKGETAEEITGAAQAMRLRVTPLDLDGLRLVDTCGTGGDGHGTFNISTTAALVAAAAGATVAKHGNRAVSSACGSADVLSALGVRIDLDARQMSAVLRSTGISFLFAPKLHPAMGSVAGVRRELGIRTIFNVLGPLTNPAFAKRQVLGVYSAHLVELMARALMALGSEHALVVHSHDGMDEISVSAPTTACELRDGALRTFEIHPSDLGLRTHSVEELRGGGAEANAGVTRRILMGEIGARRDVVVANAGAALYVSGDATSIADGVRIAQQAIDSGEAMKKLGDLIAATNSVVEGR